MSIAILGSISQDILLAADCPVLAVKAAVVGEQNKGGAGDSGSG